MKKPYVFVLAGCFAMSLSGVTLAATSASDQYKASDKQADATYKSAKEKADADYKAAKKQCDQQFKGKERPEAPSRRRPEPAPYWCGHSAVASCHRSLGLLFS